MAAGPRRLIVLAAACALAAAAQAPEDIRIALVVGNAAYPAAPLANPVNDAAAMGATLRTLGFSVTELRDATRAQMQEAVGKLRDGMHGKRAVAMLFYAGHGLQVDFRNYMVPVDARLATVADVPSQTMDVSQVIEAFRGAGTRMNILVLDACRDNPFAQGSGKGLAPLDAPSGTLLAYATAPGNVAEDGDPLLGHGVYTGFLVKELQKPAARIEDVFKRVRLQVRQYSQGRQIPWESTSLEEDFYFNDGMKYTFRPADLQKARDDAREREVRLQREAQATRERERQEAAQKALAALQQAEAQRVKELEAAAENARERERFKQMSEQRAREEAFRTEKAEWDRIKESRKVDDFYAYLARYPSGSFSEHAVVRVELLQQAQVQAQPAPGTRPQPALARRVQDGERYEFVQKDGLTGRTLARGVLEMKVHGEDDIEGVVVSGNLAGARGTIGGFVTRDGGGTYDPPWPVVPGGEYQVGKKAAGRTMRTDQRGNRSWVDYETRIVAREKLQTAFGDVDSYKVEVQRVNENGSRQKLTFWFDPEWLYSVKVVVETRNGNGAPEIVVREMVQRSRPERRL